ncbi:MAG TPA: response regulator [Candidatus Aminicenantes bacterium]|nr:response regulator [Candidatus Aminicenantes bacterium]
MAKHHILIVDDDVEIREMLVRCLQDKGYRVTATKSGSEALARLESEVPRLVITDLLLPGEHGLDLVRAIKTKWFIPTIVLSGVYAKNQIQQVMAEESVDAFFEKPVDLNKLLEKITQLLDE